MEELKQTLISPLGLSFTLLSGLLFILLPRRFALAPLFFLVSYMTLGEQIVVANCNFTMWRIILLFGWARIFIKKEFYNPIKINKIDIFVILWIVSCVLTNFILWQTKGALINRLGYAYNILGTYFLIRFLMFDIKIFENLLKIIAVLILPLALAMIIEHITKYNIFSIFGGVPEQTLIRGDSVRCQGPFRHPILAGVYGATLIPFFILLALSRKTRLLGVFSLIASITITITASSSGAIIGCISSVLGMAFFPFSKHVKKIKWLVLIFIIFTSFLMKAPIWYLIARLGNLLGGTGWHRSYLIDQSIRYFDEWWLLGTKDTSYWMPYVLENGQADITNQYLAQGVDGGILPMILFILVIFFCFSQNGLILKKVETFDSTKKIVFWAMGVTLLSHALIFMSVPYFDQVIVMYLFVIVGIAMSNNVFNNIRKRQLWNYQ